MHELNELCVGFGWGISAVMHQKQSAFMLQYGRYRAEVLVIAQKWQIRDAHYLLNGCCCSLLAWTAIS
jgi:hypothetical protein